MVWFNYSCKLEEKRLVNKAPIPQNGQTHSSAKAAELFEFVCPFCGAGA